MMTKKRMALCVMALLSFGWASAEGYYGTYDFVKADEGTTLAPTYGTTVTTGGAELQLLSVAGDSFNGKFAVGPTTRNNGTTNGFIFRTAGDYKGLWSQYDNRNFSIIGLAKGDRVTLTISTNAKTLQFVGGSTVVSGKTYTVEAAGNLDFVTTGGVYIEKVVIAEPITTERVTVGVIGYESTINFKNESTANPTAIDPLTSSDGTVFDRLAFAGTVKLTDVTFTKNYGLKILWANKLLTVKNLTKGETFTITFTTTELNISGTSILDGVADDGTLTSGQEYTVKADGNLVLNNQGKNTTIESIVISKETRNTGGSTLVSANALDFTGLDIYAYVATAISGNTVTFSKVEKVPANTPLFLTAEEAVSVDVPVLDGEAETVTTNYLKGSATEATVLDPTDAATYYIYGVNNDVAGFYKLAGESGTISSAAGKAYLEVPAGLAPSFLNISFGGEVTAVSTVRGSGLKTQGTDIYYNLAGQRVAQPTKGLYIVNGKKVVYKDN
ncbi:MAG: hypothetical protein IJ614_06905 [Prevotella sp.]|nr:hypothetical protein [Prevotella sp.]